MGAFASWSLVIAVLFISAAEARQTINGCQIKRTASCPGVNLSCVKLNKSNLAGADIAGADLCNAILQNHHAGQKVQKMRLHKVAAAKANIACI